MMNLWSALELGKNSLNTHQQTFQVIGHNIANINTEGYSRQKAQLETVAPSVIGLKSGGRGVSLLGVESFRDRFINSQIVNRKQFEGQYSTLSASLSTVEAIFDESKGYGLSDQMSNFFNAWSDLANNPSDIATRESLVYKSQSFCKSINSSYQLLIDQQEVADNSIENKITDINALAKEIAELNEKIVYAVGSDSPASDLLDQRENRIKELSGMVGTNVYYNQNNQSATIEVAGRPLVAYNTVNELSINRNTANNNYYDVFIDQYGGTPANITSLVESGELGALLSVRDTYIPSYKTNLNDLAASLINSVNSAHQQGYALDSVTTGINFFQMTGGGGQINQLQEDVPAAGTTTLTFDTANATDDLAVGDVITLNGQTALITGIPDGTHVEIENLSNPVAVPPAADWEYMTRSHAAAEIRINDDILNNAELIAASGEASLPGPGNITGIAGTTLTFDEDITGTLNVGDEITINNQRRTITAIGAPPPFTVTVDTAFSPPVTNLPAHWDYFNDSGSVGNNDTALALAALMNNEQVIDTTPDNGLPDGVADYGTFHDYLHTSLSEIGNDTASAKYELEANESMLKYLNNRRDAISGVSLDEETTDLMMTEKAYQAMAQFISTINNMTDILVQIGR